MDDDKQVRDPISQTTQYFLSDDLLAAEPKTNQFSLPGEFAHSRKNRNTLIYGLVVVYIMTIGIGAFLLISNESTKNNRLNVNISDFKQLNLTELLDTKKQDDLKIFDLKKELEDLKLELEKETGKVNQNSLTESQILLLKNLSSEEQKKAIAEIKKNQTAKITQLTGDYNAKIKLIEQALAEYEKKATTENQKLIQTAQQNQDLLSEYQNVAEFRLQKQKREYEDQLAKLRADQQTEIETLKSDHNRYVEALISRNNQLQKSLSENTEITANIRAHLASYLYAMTSLASEKRENGYVIDSRDRNQITIFIYNIYPVKKGAMAFIFRDEPNTPIAKIQLTPEGEKITAKIIEVNPGVKIKPFDKILLILEGK